MPKVRGVFRDPETGEAKDIDVSLPADWQEKFGVNGYL